MHILVVGRFHKGIKGADVNDEPKRHTANRKKEKGNSSRLDG